MRIRLGDLLEWVLVLALGLGLSRWAVMEFMPDVRQNGGRLTVSTYVEPFLAGVSLGGATGLWWDCRRRKSPRPWGIGRWTWLIACLTVVIGVAGNAGWQVMFTAKYDGLRAAVRAISPWVRNSVCGVFASRAGWAFAALWITSRIAKAPVDPAPDAREWAGRALLAAIIGWTGATLVMRMLGVY